MADNMDEFTPRPYQIDLYEKAINENTIVYLPTGAGKTFIAILLIKKLSTEIQKPYNEGGKHTAFIVNTVPLVIQQSKYIARLTGLSCGAYSGDMNVDLWSDEQWMNELQEHQVLVMTAQIFLDVLCHGQMHLNRVNLLIFDECHRAVSDHPMRQIMQRFEGYPITEQPRVLGMTATLLNSNVKLDRVESAVKSLETTFHAKVATIDSWIPIQNFCASQQQTFVTFDKYTLPSIWKCVDDIINKTTEILQIVDINESVTHNKSSAEFQPTTKLSKLSSILQNIKDQFQHAGIYGASKCILLHLIQFECLKNYSDNVKFCYVLEYLITELTKLRKLLEDEMNVCTEGAKIYNYSSDKVLKLLAILKEFYNNKLDTQKFCCIIFVEKRFTAQVLYHILKNLHLHDEEYKFLVPEFAVGFSNNPYKNSKETLCVSKWNKEVLEKFRNGLSNCLVATDVIDEGIDIPTCTLVVRYDLPLNIRAYIQSKGRCRDTRGQYVMLLEKDNTNFITKYRCFNNTESYLQKLLLGHTNYRDKPTQEDLDNELYQFDTQPYIVTGKDGVRSILTEQSAIGLLNRYCSTLLKSKFVSLTPIWILHRIKKHTMESEVLYQVSLQLPRIAQFKETIFGDVMNAIGKAKRSVAMKMCIELHKIGELSDKLLPNRSNAVLESTGYLFPHWVDEDKSETNIIGTYKRKRQHKLQFPTALYNAYPVASKLLYLHILHTKPTYSVPLDNRHLAFYNLLCNNATFGILSTKLMPQIPSFPIFMNVGELNVSVKTNYTTMTLSEEEIQDVKMFHSLMFSQIVPVIKPFMIFDTDNLDNSFLITPVNENWEINWNVIREYQDINYIPPTVPFSFKTSDYDLALVVPSYRASPNVYIVTQVCEDLTPDCCFPTDDYLSYANYYKERHGLVINNVKQPMLEVKPISKNINCIKPRSMKPGLSKRRRADLLEDFEEHLIPELCMRIKFPALYWLKTTMLPSILHRISQFLVAEDLRTTIVAEAKLGSLCSPHNAEWPSLVINYKEKKLFKPPLEISLDQTLENLQPEPSPSGPEINVLNTEANQYPWTKDQEPPDLDRNIEQIQIIDIASYCQFMYGADDPEPQMKIRKISFNKASPVSAPPLNILSKEDPSGPDPVQVMYALTSKSGNDAFDLERLETLGDSYLKFITSLYLYTFFPQYSEGNLTALKGKIIGNRNLYYCGTNKCIPGCMKVDDFIPMSTFIAPAYTVWRQLQTLLLQAEVSPNVLYDIQIPLEERFSGYISEGTNIEMKNKVLNWDEAESHTGMEHYLGVQTVPDKTVADCVEALIGVYLNSLGVKGAMGLLQWFAIIPKEINADQLLYGSLENPLISEGDPDVHIPGAAQIEARLGYKFQNRAFLLQAFTHPSYTANTITECYQRLEFLGDAILDFLITSYIYQNCEDLSPGDVTDLRSALVNNITFSCLAVRHGLHTGLLAYAPKLNDSIDRFVKFQDERDHVVTDELLWVLLEEEECNMAEYVDVPKVLGDLYESVIGAIYLDCGKDLSTVWKIIYSIMHKEIDEFSKNVPKQPIRVLYETPSARPQFSHASLIEGTSNVMVSLKVIIAGKTKVFHGFGANTKQAKCAAAKQALKHLVWK